MRLRSLYGFVTWDQLSAFMSFRNEWRQVARQEDEKCCIITRLATGFDLLNIAQTDLCPKAAEFGSYEECFPETR